MRLGIVNRNAPAATWTTYREAAAMFVRGATVPSAARISFVVGTWLSLVNQGGPILRGEIPWAKVLLNYVTPFAVASLGFLAARRRSNVERLVSLLREDGEPRSRPGSEAPRRSE